MPPSRARQTAACSALHRAALPALASFPGNEPCQNMLPVFSPQWLGASAASLTLKAQGSIIINQSISSTGGALSVTLDANTLGAGGFVDVQAVRGEPQIELRTERTDVHRGRFVRREHPLRSVEV